MISVQILATLAYTDQFEYPLSEKEIWERLVGVDNLKNVFAVKMSENYPGATYSEVKKTLKILVVQGKVIKNKQFYCLPGSEENFKTRVIRKKLSKKNKQEIEKFVTFVRKIPWIMAVAVTGSQAMENVSHERDDIDFLIITARERLWLVRPIVILFSFFSGKKILFWQKTKDNSMKKDAWCFNLWLDEDHLKLPEKRRNFYTAYEVGQVKWVFEKLGCDIKDRFEDENNWVRGFLPNIFTKNSTVLRNKKAREIKAFFYINKFFYYMQFKYLTWKLKIPSSNASEGEAFLHLGNMKKVVYNRWRRKLVI